MNKLEEQLRTSHYAYSADFEQEVIQRIRQFKADNWPKISWILTGIAASVVFCLFTVYMQDGGISFDNILGINLLNGSNYNDILTYYQS